MRMNEGLEIGKDQREIAWIDRLWLAKVMLTKDNVISYFMRSPFYNKKSDNETIAMQKHSFSNLKYK